MMIRMDLPRRACRTGVVMAGLSVVAAAALPPGQVQAQTVRLTGATTVRYVSARGLREDSVLASATVGDGVLRHTAGGQPVRCFEEAPYCRYLAAGDVLSAVPLTQDIGISAWGFGRGIRIHANLRARLPLFGDEALWPRSGDHFDALEAYLEIARSHGRLRLGRQWQSSGLGLYGYDGASVLAAYRALSVEAFGGWSLLRGLAEPITDGALAAIEPFAPDSRGVLLGSRLQLRSAGAGGALGYQREIRSDRLGLYSERATASGFLRRQRFALEAVLDADVATRELNHLRLQASARPLNGVTVEAFGRRYRPYFDLWTIWGAFTPVGFAELGGAAHVSTEQLPFALDLSAARRSYRETDASLTFAPLQADGWRLDASVSGALAPAWGASARYAADVGFGAARSQVDLRLRHDLSERAWVGAEGTLFDRGSEFQLTDGVVLGGGIDGGWALNPRTRATAHLVAYRHLVDRTGTGVDWTQ
ncbi:MAG TPA: hypothetical protein VK939_08010, partial [Longimicrobiales bacterium]|nr:hypothetical protein [Longimicrobiales bacterium]